MKRTFADLGHREHYREIKKLEKVVEIYQKRGIVNFFLPLKMKIRKLKKEEIEEELRIIKEFLCARPYFYCRSKTSTTYNSCEEVKCSFEACAKRYTILKNTIFHCIKLTKLNFYKCYNSRCLKNQGNRFVENLIYR
jgi:hypothetical protein